MTWAKGQFYSTSCILSMSYILVAEVSISSFRLISLRLKTFVNFLLDLIWGLTLFLGDMRFQKIVSAMNILGESSLHDSNVSLLNAQIHLTEYCDFFICQCPLFIYFSLS